MVVNHLRMSDFYCVECGNKGIPVMRPTGKNRGPGHLKKLYCIHCKKETNHCEIRPIGHYTYEDFQQERELGRFVNGQRTSVKDLPICNKHDCHYCIHNKCWNSNHSFHCDYRLFKEV